jgi:putative endonuclease
MAAPDRAGGVSGRVGEWMALAWLVVRGYRLRHRNWRGGGGEIDLVMKHRGELVFVEVKSRRSGDFGGALAAVGGAKQRRLARAAGAYLSRHELWDEPCRFDVVAIQRRRGLLPFVVVHVRDAFQPDLGRTL